ncbi:MAG: nuclear transport factor 2 family protein [Carboxylicivirga sp.]|jgi:hypothetical protein|nr:nuclear transport factor 2 family protein [Carboxylicivirga sp.]
MSFRDFLSTEDFNYIGIHGEITDYKGLIKEAKAVFDPAQSVQYNFRIANIKVLSHETVLANYISSGTFTFPDTQLYFPECATSLVFIKKLDGWKVIQMHESVQESEFVNTTIKN